MENESFEIEQNVALEMGRERLQHLNRKTSNVRENLKILGLKEDYGKQESGN